MAKRILVIDASPRKGQTTDQLCDAFIEGAQANGNIVTKFSVAGKKINGCIHCMGCAKAGTCVQQDDMTPIFEDIEKADMIILASPIYFWHITSQLKAVIDRMFALSVAKKPLQGKDTALILASGGPEDDNMLGALAFYKDVIQKHLSWNDKGIVKADRTMREGFDMNAKLAEAKALGLSIK